jgi:hypothetical protein
MLGSASGRSPDPSFCLPGHGTFGLSYLHMGLRMPLTLGFEATGIACWIAVGLPVQSCIGVGLRSRFPGSLDCRLLLLASSLCRYCGLLVSEWLVAISFATGLGECRQVCRRAPSFPPQSPGHASSWLRPLDCGWVVLSG